MKVYILVIKTESNRAKAPRRSKNHFESKVKQMLECSTTNATIRTIVDDLEMSFSKSFKVKENPV